MDNAIGTIYPDPNTLYDSNHTIIYTINGTTGTNQFLNTYNHSNRYNGLKLGQRIQININDGEYNKTWYIAGFDCEYNRVASDDSLYGNGYGIMLIPETYLTSSVWNTTATTSGGYLNSYMNKTTLVNVANKLKNVLGDHLIERNVLLSSSTDSSGSTAYTWTTSYCTLPSVGQMIGTFASSNNKYDDGEANYKLPLFDHMEYKTITYIWLRNIYNNSSALNMDYDWDGGLTVSTVDLAYGVRPLIYIR